MSETDFALLRDYAFFANASYADFATEGEVTAETAKATFNNVSGGLIPATLTESILTDNNWSVLHHNSGNLSGFAATVFQYNNNGNNEVVFSIRGSEEIYSPSAFFSDWLTSNFAGIGALDIAADQAISLFNYFQRLITPEGEPAWQLFFDPIKAVLDGSLGIAKLSTGLGIIDSGDKVNVVGHSLGGHLAIVAKNLFPSMIDKAYSFNGALFGKDVSSVLEFFYNAMEEKNLSPTSADDLFSGWVNRVNSESTKPGDDWDIVPGLFTGSVKPGTEIQITTEDNSHSVGQILDALSLHSFIKSLSDSISTEQVYEIFDAVANIAEKTQETFLENIYQALTGIKESIGVTVEPGSTSAGDFNARDTYFGYFKDKILATIENKFGNFTGSESGLQITSLANWDASQLYQAATENSDLSQAVRYALVNGLPFTFAGEIYKTDINDGAYNLEKFTGEYLQARSLYLVSLLDRNVEQLENGDDIESSLNASMSDFNDTITPEDDIELELRAKQQQDINSHYIFASSQVNTLQGTAANDSFFAGAGDDTLMGSNGQNYLEGGDGNDEYRFETASSTKGLTTINDDDGKIFIDGIELTGKLRPHSKNGNSYTLEDGQGNPVAGFEQALFSLEYRNIGSENFPFLVYDLLIMQGNTRILVKDIIIDSFGLEVIDSNFQANEITPDLQVLNGDTDNDGELDISPVNETRPTSTNAQSLSYVAEDYQSQFLDLLDAEGNPGTDNTNDTLVNFRFDGGNKNDEMIGKDWNTELAGGVGLDDSAVTYLQVSNQANTQTFMIGDIMRGRDGNDVIYGDGTDLELADTSHDVDILIGGKGDDQLFGGGGNDVLFAAETNAWYDTVQAMPNPLTELEASNEENYLDGGAGNDWLVGASNKDTLLGQDGEDFITAGQGADFVHAGSGDDIVYGDSQAKEQEGFLGKSYLDWLSSSEDPQQHNDSIELGDGNDLAFGEAGDDLIKGDDGDDVIWGDRWLSADENFDPFDLGSWSISHPGQPLPDEYLSLDATQHGNDILQGGMGNDELHGQGGDDFLFGGQGHDILRGDDNLMDGSLHGNDQIHAGEGDDVVEGNGGADVILGGQGNDNIWGDRAIHNDSGFYHDQPGFINQSLDSGDETSRANTGFHGNDSIDAGDGDDQVWGGNGDDVIHGGAGRDLIWGDSADQGVEKGWGSDQIFAGDGDDQVIGGDGNDIINGGSGDDLILGDRDNDTGLGGQDQISGAEGNDYIEGGLQADSIDGGKGNDVLYGQQGNDQLMGGDGDDQIAGDFSSFAPDSGADLLNGGAGNDTLYGGAGKDTLYGGTGDDFIWGDYAEAVSNTPASHDTIFGDEGNDYIDGGEHGDIIYGGDDHDTLHGNNGWDTLFGESGMDILLGANGFDLLFGGDDDDQLSGGKGDDRLYGGAGDDLVVGDDANDSLYGEAGNDVLDGKTGADLLDGGSGDDQLAGGLGNDVVYGGDGNDLLLGDTGDDDQGGLDTLFGGNGSDSIWGGSGIDYLDGGSGNDTLVGEGGNDTLVSSAGNDTLSGGAGSDTYIFKTGDGTDQIYTADFNANDIEYLVFEDAVSALDIGFYAGVFYHGDDDEVYTGLDSGSLDYFNNGNPIAAVRLLVGENGETDITEQVLQRTLSTNEDTHNIGSNHQDLLITGAGNDLIEGHNGNDVLRSGSGEDTLFGGAGNDELSAGISSSETDSDTLEGGQGNDILRGYGGQDVYRFAIGDGRDEITADRASDADILFFKGNLTIGDLHATEIPEASNQQSYVLQYGPDPDDRILLHHDNYYLQFENGEQFYLSNLLQGYGFWKTDLSGNDIVFEGTEHKDKIKTGEGSDTLLGGDASDTLQSTGGTDWISGGSGSDYLDAGEGVNSLLLGGAGNDQLFSDGNSVSLSGGEGDDRLEIDAGNENTHWLYGDAGHDTLQAGPNSKATLYGGDGNDKLYRIDTHATLIGGLGDDSYFLSDYDVNYSSQKIIENADEGYDTIILDSLTIPYGGLAEIMSFTLPDNIEALQDNRNYAAPAFYSLSESILGNSLDNTIIGNSKIKQQETRQKIYGADGDDSLSQAYYLYGEQGDDNLSNGVSMVGGAGNDYMYDGEFAFVENLGDTTSNINTIVASIDYQLDATSRNLTLVGQAEIAVGNDLGNVFKGNALSNTFVGGLGDDVYYLQEGDQYLENPGEGSDTVALDSVDLRNPQWVNIENGMLTDTGTGWLTGDEQDNVLTGNSLNNTLQGLQGNDTLQGKGGNDTYLISRDNNTTRIIESGGSDTIEFDESISYQDFNNAAVTFHHSDIYNPDKKIWELSTEVEIRFDWGQAIIIENWSENTGAAKIENLYFADSDTSVVFEINNQLPTINNDNISTPVADRYVLQASQLLANDEAGLAIHQVYGAVGGEVEFDPLSDTVTFINHDPETDLNSNKNYFYYSVIDPAGNSYAVKTSKVSLSGQGFEYPPVANDDYIITKNGNVIAIGLLNGTAYDDEFYILEDDNLLQNDYSLENESLSIVSVMPGTEQSLSDVYLETFMGNDFILYNPADLPENINEDVFYYELTDNTFDPDAPTTLGTVNITLAGDRGIAGNFILGSSNDDYILAASEGDTYNGGAGDDFIHIEAGVGDTIVYQAYNGGSDTISLKALGDTSSRVNTLSIETDLAVEDIQFFYNDSDLVLQFGPDGSSAITIIDFADHNANQFDQYCFSLPDSMTCVMEFDRESLQAFLERPTEQSDEIRLLNNTSLNAGAGDDVIYGHALQADTLFGGSGNDYLDGGAFGHDTLSGGEGDDILLGFSMDDLLVGGLGNDQLSGDDGDDTYLFTKGDGQDLIFNNESRPADNQDVLQIEGYATEDIWLGFSRDLDDLLINFDQSDDAITVHDYFVDDSSRIDKIVAGDSYLDQSGIDKLIEAMANSDQPDSVGEIVAQEQKEAYQAIIAETWLQQVA